MTLTVWYKGNVIFGVIFLGRWFLRVVWSCANSFSASLSHSMVLDIWPPGGLDNRVHVTAPWGDDGNQ